MRVIKLGGNELDTPSFRHELARMVAALDQPTVLVHGGGSSVDEIQILLGSTPERVDGLRRTDAAALEAALMVLCGRLRSQIVEALLSQGIRAIGLSGFDAGLVRVRKLHHPEIDLGLVGEVVSVQADLLHMLLDAGLTPVVSPLSIGIDNQIYNVNADHVAASIAAAMGADELDFISNVAGVHRSGRVVPQLEVELAEGLIAQKEIRDGMVPKVRAGTEAINGGVPQVRIADLAGLASGGGTLLTSNTG